MGLSDMEKSDLLIIWLLGEISQNGCFMYISGVSAFACKYGACFVS